MSRAKLMSDAIDAFVVGCKADGIWDSIKSCCILAGWDGLAGALTPIKGSAPTNNNFVSADYNRKTGLVGDGSTKFLNTNRLGTADPQNSFHIGVYASTVTSANKAYIGVGGGEAGASSFFQTSGTTIGSRSRSANLGTAAGHNVAGFIGHSRNSSTSYTMRGGGSNSTQSTTTDGTLAQNTVVFAVRTNAGLTTGHAEARLAFYSIGESLDLALLDSRVSTLLTSIWRAVHPEFTVVTNPDAMDWIGRVYDAGGSVSVSTANAVNTFCNAIDSAGIRSKFLRLNLFAGNDLTSALVPLYRSSAYGGAVVGGATDTNNNFVSADYVETGPSGGITGNGTTKYLDTGVFANTSAASDTHLGIGLLATDSTASGDRNGIGAWNGGANVLEIRLRDRGGAAPLASSFTRYATVSDRFGDSVASSPLAVGNIVSAWPSMYRNGAQSGTTATTSQDYPSAHKVYVFALNNANSVSPVNYSNCRLGWYSIGKTMTAAQVASFDSAITALSSSLSRT